MRGTSEAFAVTTLRRRERNVTRPIWTTKWMAIHRGRRCVIFVAKHQMCLTRSPLRSGLGARRGYVLCHFSPIKKLIPSFSDQRLYTLMRAHVFFPIIVRDFLLVWKCRQNTLETTACFPTRDAGNCRNIVEQERTQISSFPLARIQQAFSRRSNRGFF